MKNLFWSDMSMDELVLKQWKIGRQPSILLGNGFSLAHPTLSNQFQWQALKGAAKCTPFQTAILSVVGDVFEKAMDKVEDGIFLLDQINTVQAQKAAERLRKELDRLRHRFILSVGKQHPARRSVISNEAAVSIRDFSYCFKNIFSLNYDLLLYWCYLESTWNDYFDGFSTNYLWGGTKSTQRVFYLHGSLGFYQDSFGTKKLKHDQYSKSPVSVILKGLRKKQFPVVVAEAKGSNKKTYIQSNLYLAHAFGSFLKTKGSLFTYGCSFENDSHLVEEIVNNTNLKRAFIGVYADEESNESYRIRGIFADAFSKNTCSKLQVILFSTVSFNPWVEHLKSTYALKKPQFQKI